MSRRTLLKRLGLGSALLATYGIGRVHEAAANHAAITDISSTQGAFPKVTLQEYIELENIAAASVASPATGLTRVFRDSADSKLKRKNPDGSLSNIEGWEFLGSTSLGANATSLGPLTIAARKHIMIIAHVVGYSGGSIAGFQFNGDTANNYSSSISDGVTAPTNTTNTNYIRVAETNITGPRFVKAVVRNVASTVKKLLGQGQSNSDAAGTAPTLNNIAGIWANTAAQITTVTLWSGNAGINLLAGTEFAVWGRDDD